MTTDGWRSRIVGHDEVPARSLVPNPANWRVHPDAQRDALRGVLGEVGWVDEVMVNRRTGRIVDGHLRVEEAAARDVTVPVTYVDLSEDEERLVLATFDPLTGLATADQDALAALIASTDADSPALRELLDRLANREVFDELLGGTPYGLTDLGFEVAAKATTPEDRDRLVSLIRAAGFDPEVRAIR